MSSILLTKIIQLTKSSYLITYECYRFNWTIKIMTIDQKLHDVGLTPLEIKVYLYLLENGISSPPQISKSIHLARSNTHYILQGLVKKDMVKKQNKGKRFVYIPADPAVTMQAMERQRKMMEDVIPDLRALYKKSTNKPVVKFYEGVDEIKQIFEDILKTKSEKVIAFASTATLFELIPDYFQTRFQKILKQRGIFFQRYIKLQILRKSARDEKKYVSIL